MNTSIRRFWPIVVIAVWVAAGLVSRGAYGDDAGVEVKPVRAEKLPNVPGKTITAVTVNYAPGAKSTAHQHAGSVFVYVLTGSVRSENSATGPAQVYKAGESFFEPAGSKHLVSENASATEPASILAVFVADDGAQLTTFDAAPPAAPADLAQQIFDTMLKVHGVTAGHRPVHAKALVCEGSFAPTKEAAALSKAAHFQAASVPVVVRFSDGSPDLAIPDNAPNAGPRGMAVRFKLPNNGQTDIVAISHNGFVVATGEEFLALQQAVVATDPSKPHPWPVEDFLGAHPLALKFVQDSAVIPTSFGTASFFANDAFVFVNKDGAKQAGRYKIIPVEGQKDLSDADAKAKAADFLIEDLKTRLKSGPVLFQLVAQLPNAGDVTKDPSIVWPDDRKAIVLGSISITSVDADTVTTEKALAYDPTNLTDGIELSDDPFPALRSKVYAMSVKFRNK